MQEKKWKRSKMRSENAIEVKGVTKKFRVYLDRGYTLKELTLFKKRRIYEERIVLNNISFSVKQGQALGLIGRNGCGKSTTLKLLTRIIYPDFGSINMAGRVSSLIELGAGFHPDMSGRQNIYTNAAIFGLTRKEIDKRIDNIIAFSELEEFIDNPVRTYSSGMYMRLAFAVAINVDADILLIDEILAVGDANFQAKCFERLHEIKRNGTTIVIVSHAMDQIEKICDRCIWIENGKIEADGKPKEISDEYLFAMEKSRFEDIEKGKIGKKAEETENERNKGRKEQEIEDKWARLRNKIPLFAEPSAIRMGTGEIEFINVHMLDEKDEEKSIFKTGDTIKIRMNYRAHKKNLKGNFGIGIFREDGVHCYGTNIYIESGEKIDVKEYGCVEVRIEKCLLLPGRYFLDIAIHGEYGYFYDDIRRVATFRITSMKKDVGVVRLETSWNVK